MTTPDTPSAMSEKAASWVPGNMTPACDWCGECEWCHKAVMPFATSDPEILAIRDRCPTHAVCPPCREGLGHWRSEDGECVDCWVNGPHYCVAYGTAREAMTSD